MLKGKAAVNMRRTEKRMCHICGGKLFASARGVVSPWIRSLGVRHYRVSKYMSCDSCSSGFFSFRYSDDEMQKIYGSYRGENYLAVRSKWEPWYNQSFNEEHDSEEYVLMRQESLYKFLRKYLSTVPETLVDVGGDRGQYIPNCGQIKSYVIEPSSKKLINGVIRLSNLDEINKSNLILYSHVLEHVANPKEEIVKLLQHCDQMYIEVPFGIPEISRARKSKIRFLIKLISSLSPVFWRKYSTPATGRSSKQGVLVQSEHINFFTEKSFQKLAGTLNLEAHIEVNSIKTPDRVEAKVIQCLLSPRKEKEM